MAAWLDHLNPVPSFPSYSGPYPVGSIDVETPSSPLNKIFGFYKFAPSKESDAIQIKTLQFRVFYPCEPNTQRKRKEKPVYWVPKPQRKVLSAYAKFVGLGEAVSDVFARFPNLIYHTKIPVHADAPVLASPHKEARWPVLVFSHGLGGSRNSYSHIAASLASHGIVVFAPEHRDGSCTATFVRDPEANDKELQQVPYVKLSHTASDEVYKGRDEQLRIRLHELMLLHECIFRIDRGQQEPQDWAVRNLASKDENSLNILQAKLDIHKHGKIAFAGHSFGASTVVQFVKAAMYSGPAFPREPPYMASNSPILTRINPDKWSWEGLGELNVHINERTPLLLLDPWALPLNSPATTQLAHKPLPALSLEPADRPIVKGPDGVYKHSVPVVAVLSEAFYKWRNNLLDVQQYLADPFESRGGHGAHIFYPLRSAHLSQSDFGVLFPRITKYFVKADEPERTLRLNVRAMLQVLREAPEYLPVAGMNTGEDGEKDLGGPGEEPEEEWEVLEGRDERGNVLAREDVAVTPNNDFRRFGKQTGWDARILSRREGALRGWIALQADEPASNAADEVSETREDAGKVSSSL